MTIKGKIDHHNAPLYKTLNNLNYHLKKNQNLQIIIFNDNDGSK